jgi:hypothetical protein
MKVTSTTKHYHFCPRCGYAVVCPEKRGHCLYLKNGEACTRCGGTWTLAKDEPKEAKDAQSA